MAFPVKYDVKRILPNFRQKYFSPYFHSKFRTIRIKEMEICECDPKIELKRTELDWCGQSGGSETSQHQMSSKISLAKENWELFILIRFLETLVVAAIIFKSHQYKLCILSCKKLDETSANDHLRFSN